MKHSVLRHCRAAATSFVIAAAAFAAAADPAPPELVVRLESLRAFDETLWALREQTADRAAAEETMLAQAKLFAGLGIDYMRPDEPILAAFWNLSWPVDLGKLDFLAVLPVRRGSVAPRVRIHLMDEEAQTVGGLTIRPVGPPEWKDYAAPPPDAGAAGAAAPFIGKMEQPFFPVFSVATSLDLKSGSTAVLGGTLLDVPGKGPRHQLFFLTAETVDLEGNPVP